MRLRGLSKKSVALREKGALHILRLHFVIPPNHFLQITHSPPRSSVCSYFIEPPALNAKARSLHLAIDSTLLHKAARKHACSLVYLWDPSQNDANTRLANQFPVIPNFHLAMKKRNAAASERCRVDRNYCRFKLRACVSCVLISVGTPTGDRAESARYCGKVQDTPLDRKFRRRWISAANVETITIRQAKWKHLLLLFPGGDPGLGRRRPMSVVGRKMETRGEGRGHLEIRARQPAKNKLYPWGIFLTGHASLHALAGNRRGSEYCAKFITATGCKRRRLFRKYAAPTRLRNFRVFLHTWRAIDQRSRDGSREMLQFERNRRNINSGICKNF